VLGVGVIVLRVGIGHIVCVCMYSGYRGSRYRGIG
jgi:hypothetical protein